MKRVLICDDATFMRAAIKNILIKLGFEIAGEAENGEIAIKKYKELSPDLVTMDITMPEKDGIQALTEIKLFDKDAKVIMISAMGQENFVRRAIVSGAKGFIVKPFKEEIVTNELSKFL